MIKIDVCRFFARLSFCCARLESLYAEFGSNREADTNVACSASKEYPYKWALLV